MSSARPVEPRSRGPLPGFAARRTARCSWFALIAAVLTMPGSVWAATPEVPGGSTGEPQTDLLGQLFGFVVPLVAVAIAVGVLVGIAMLVARIGGRTATAAPASEASPRARTRSLLGRGVSVLIAIAAIVLGIYLGRAIAYYGSLGDLGGVLAVGVLGFILVAPIVGLVLIGLIATKLRHGKPNLAIWTILAAGGLLAVGGIGGKLTAGATGGLYQAPLVLSATGETHADLTGGTMPFVKREGGRADCRSVSNGRTVAMVTALEVGRLGSGDMRATLSLAGTGSDGATAEFWIADVADGTVQPFWRGYVQVIESRADGASGRLTFDLQRTEDIPPKGDATPAPAATSAWPPTISGTLSWICQPW